MQNDILVTHGVDPLAVQMIRNPLNSSRINVVHFLKQKSCRTAVGLTRPSTSLDRPERKTWMPGTSPGMTKPQLPPLPEKLPEQHRRRALAEAGIDLRRVMTGGRCKEPHTALDRAALGIGRAVIEAADAGKRDRAGAHGAWLERDIEIAIGEPLAGKLFSGLANGQYLGMRGRIAVGKRPVPGCGDHLAVADDDTADRHLAGFSSHFGGSQRQIHERGGVHASYCRNKSANARAFTSRRAPSCPATPTNTMIPRAAGVTASKAARAAMGRGTARKTSPSAALGPKNLTRN